MIMVLCLMIYSYTEWLLRTRLKEENETVLNQKRKPTSKPTMKWIYFKFREIKTCFIWANNEIISIVHQLTEERLKILKMLGADYEKYYV